MNKPRSATDPAPGELRRRIGLGQHDTKSHDIGTETNTAARLQNAKTKTNKQHKRKDLPTARHGHSTNTDAHKSTPAVRPRAREAMENAITTNSCANICQQHAAVHTRLRHISHVHTDAHKDTLAARPRAREAMANASFTNTCTKIC